MTSIGDLIQIETQKMTWWDKLTLNKPKIYQTSSLAKPLKASYSKKEQILSPSLFYKMIETILMLLFGFTFFVFLMSNLDNMTHAFPWVILAVNGLFLYTLGSDSFLRKKHRFKILLNKEGLQINHQIYRWHDLQETAIQQIHVGRSSFCHVILFHKNGTVIRYDLRKFAISASKLASYIEYYKHQLMGQGT